MEEERIYCVYQHIRLDKNQVFYVGIGSKYRPYDLIGRNKYWNNIVQLNPNYEIQVLFENLTWKECCKKEIWYIKLYGRRNLNTGSLCNLTDGGEGMLGYKHSEDALRRIGEHSKNRPRIKGYKQKITDEERKVRSDRMKNRVFTDELRANISKSRIGNTFASGHVLSQESKDKIGIAFMKPILQYDLQNNFIQEFKSIKEACKVLEINESGIIRCCKNKTSKYMNYIWKYK